MLSMGSVSLSGPYVRHWLPTPTSSVPLLAQHILQAGHIVCQMFCVWVGTHIFLLIAYRVPIHTKGHSNIQVQTPCRLQINFYMFSESCGCYSQQWGTAISLLRATHCLYHSRSCLGHFHGTLLGQNSIKRNPVPVLEVSFGDKK